MVMWNDIVEPDRSPGPGLGQPLRSYPTQDVVIFSSPAPVNIGKPVKFLDLGPRETRHSSEEGPIQ